MEKLIIVPYWQFAGSLQENSRDTIAVYWSGNGSSGRKSHDTWVSIRLQAPAGHILAARLSAFSRASP